MFREVQTLERIDHPNVVRILGAATIQIGDNEHKLLKCEFVDGGTVEDAVDAMTSWSCPTTTPPFAHRKAAISSGTNRRSM